MDGWMDGCRSELSVRTCTRKGYLISQPHSSRSRGPGLLTAAKNNQSGIRAPMCTTVTTAILKIWAAARKMEVGTKGIVDAPIHQQLGELSSTKEACRQMWKQWTRVSAGLWAVFTHKILRMVGIADDEGGLQPQWAPLSFVFSVRRRNPPARVWEVSQACQGWCHGQGQANVQPSGKNN